MNIPRPKTSKGNRDIENILHDLDAILTEPKPAPTGPTVATRFQEISTEEQDELINEFLQNESQTNMSHTNSVVPPLNLVGQGPVGNGSAAPTSRDTQQIVSSRDQVCKNCGAKMVSISLTPYTSRVCCLKCSHSQKSEGAETQATDSAAAVATSRLSRAESPTEPTSRSFYGNTTRRSSEQSERDEIAATEEANQKSKKKHKRCKMCNTNKNAIRLLPCKHKCCAECAKDLTQCYVEKCKQEIKDKIVYQRSKSDAKNKQNEE